MRSYNSKRVVNMFILSSYINSGNSAVTTDKYKLKISS